MIRREALLGIGSGIAASLWPLPLLIRALQEQKILISMQMRNLSHPLSSMPLAKRALVQSSVISATHIALRWSTKAKKSMLQVQPLV